MARNKKRQVKKQVKAANKAVKSPSPPQGNAGKNPIGAAVDTFKSDTWRT